MHNYSIKKTKKNSKKNSKTNTKTNTNTNTNTNTKINIIKKHKFSYKNIKKYENDKEANKENKEQNSNNINSDNNDNDNDSKSFIIRFSSRKFLSQTQSIIRRGPKLKIKKHNEFAMFITDVLDKLKRGKSIYKKKLDKHIFNDSETKCICKNIYKSSKKLPDDCECENIKTYSAQGKSGAVIYSINCGNQQDILKIINMTNYYMKMRTETNNYIFIELDGFSLQTIINTNVYKELPNNTINIVNSGVCKNKYRGLKGYNLMEEADLGSGRQFFIKLLSGVYDDNFNIKNEDNRYVYITNYLLQVIFIIGHLQSTKLEFFHGDYKPENVFVKRIERKSLDFFTFRVFGKVLKVKNLGFAVLIADFDRSSITVEEEFNPKKYRIIPPILFKTFLSSNVNDIIKKSGDIDPDTNVKKSVKLEKLFISHFVPQKKDPTITVLRSAGVKIFRDIDLYTFFIKLLDSVRIREYFMTKRFNVTIMSFMSPKFIDALFAMPAKEVSLNESAYIAINILDKIKQPMNSVFTDYYIETLSSLNYRLFK